MRMGLRTALMLSASISLAGWCLPKRAGALSNKIPAAETIMDSGAVEAKKPGGRLAPLPKKAGKEPAGVSSYLASGALEKKGGLDWAGARITKAGFSEEGSGFLDSIYAEFTHAGYARVGSVNMGSIEAGRGPVSIGIGAGAEKLEYYADTLFFITPKLEVRGILGDFEMYMVGSAPIIPKGPADSGGKKGISASAYGTLGGVWEALPQGKGMGPSFRLGAEIEASGVWGEDGIQQGIVQAAYGASAGYGRITAYAIENSVFFGGQAHSQYGIESLAPHHHKLRAGIILSQPGADFGAEFFHTPFEKGGKFSVTFKGKDIVPGVYGWGSKGWGLIGDAGGAGVGATLAFGSKGYGGRAKVERGLGSTMNGEGSTLQKATPWKEKGARAFFFSAIKESGNLSEFAEKYLGKNEAYVLNAARGLAVFGYANYDTNLNVRNYFSEEAKEGNVIDEEVVFRAVRRGTLEKEYSGGAGVCSNISALQSEFLRKVGWKAYSIQIAGKMTPDISSGVGPHNITVAKNPRKAGAFLFNHTRVYESEKGKIWPIVREVSKEAGVIPLGMYIYGEGNRLIGHYESKEKELNRAMAGDRETLKEALLHSRPRKEGK